MLKYEEYYLSITPKKELEGKEEEGDNYKIGYMDGLKQIVETNL